MQQVPHGRVVGVQTEPHAGERVGADLCQARVGVAEQSVFYGEGQEQSQGDGADRGRQGQPVQAPHRQRQGSQRGHRSICHGWQQGHRQNAQQCHWHPVWQEGGLM